MQLSRQPTYSLAKKKMNPKHCVSNWAHSNENLENQIHYTNTQYFGTVLNYRIIAIVYVKWEKFVSCFRWRIHQPIGKYIVTKNICLSAVVNTNTNTWNVKVRGSWWRWVYIGRFKQNIIIIIIIIIIIDLSNDRSKASSKKITSHSAI